MVKKKNCRSCGCEQGKWNKACACWCHTHAVDRYEPLSLLPAAEGWRAAYQDGDAIIFEPIVMWAVCMHKRAHYLPNGRKLGKTKREGRVILGMILVEQFIEEACSADNFVCYAEPGLTELGLKIRLRGGLGSGALEKVEAP